MGGILLCAAYAPGVPRNRTGPTPKRAGPDLESSRRLARRSPGQLLLAQVHDAGPDDDEEVAEVLAGAAAAEEERDDRDLAEQRRLGLEVHDADVLEPADEQRAAVRDADRGLRLLDV